MQQGTMELLWRSSHISGGNAVYVEAMYEAYLRDPNAIAAQWRDYFDRLPQVEGTQIDVPHSTVQEQFALLARQKSRPAAPVVHPGVSTEYERKQVHVVQLISAYRQRGHQKASLDPLGLVERERVPDLDLPVPPAVGSRFRHRVPDRLALHRQGTRRRCARSSRRSSAPIAAPSARNSCTSSPPRSATGSSAAWTVCAPRPSTMPR